MTESEWLASTDPTPMLAFVRGNGRLSEWRRHLFVCACVRRVWRLLSDERSRKALEMAETLPYELVGAAELRAAVLAADKAAYRANGRANQAKAARQAARVARATLKRLAADERTPTAPHAIERAEQVARRARERAAKLAAQAEETRGAREAARAVVLCVRAAWYRTQNLPGTEISWQQAVEAAAVAAGNTSCEDRIRCDLLRDIAGNPFRPPPAVNAAWLAWHDGAVRNLAEVIFQERAFERMPALTDALEDAGCADPVLLGHLRGPGPHTRGCFVIDSLLGKS